MPHCVIHLNYRKFIEKMYEKYITELVLTRIRILSIKIWSYTSLNAQMQWHQFVFEWIKILKDNSSKYLDKAIGSRERNFTMQCMRPY